MINLSANFVDQSINQSLLYNQVAQNIVQYHMQGSGNRGSLTQQARHAFAHFNGQNNRINLNQNATTDGYVSLANTTQNLTLNAVLESGRATAFQAHGAKDSSINLNAKLTKGLGYNSLGNADNLDVDIIGSSLGRNNFSITDTNSRYSISAGHVLSLGVHQASDNVTFDNLLSGDQNDSFTFSGTRSHVKQIQAGNGRDYFTTGTQSAGNVFDNVELGNGGDVAFMYGRRNHYKNIDLGNGDDGAKFRDVSNNRIDSLNFGDGNDAMYLGQNVFNSTGNLKGGNGQDTITIGINGGYRLTQIASNTYNYIDSNGNNFVLTDFETAYDRRTGQSITL